MNTVIHRFRWHSFFPSLNPSLFNYVAHKYGPCMSTQLTSGLQGQGPSDSSPRLAINSRGSEYGILFLFLLLEEKKKKNYES